MGISKPKLKPFHTKANGINGFGSAMILYSRHMSPNWCDGKQRAMCISRWAIEYSPFQCCNPMQKLHATKRNNICESAGNVCACENAFICIYYFYFDSNEKLNIAPRSIRPEFHVTHRFTQKILPRIVYVGFEEHDSVNSK